jgi:hypothetical protein
MLALVATLTIQALVALAALAPAVLAPVAAPEIGVATSRIGIYTAIVYGAACVSSLTSGRLIAALGPMRLSQASLALCGLGACSLPPAPCRPSSWAPFCSVSATAR